MANASRKIAFILACTDQGTLIVNRLDYCMVSATSGYGVGLSLLEGSSYEMQEGSIATQLLRYRRQYFGDGVVAVDCGANIGVHTVKWAKDMTGWGSVIAVEAQERIFYALAGNVTINNCFNAQIIHAAVGARLGTLRIPSPNYLIPASFGSLELIPSDHTEFIGQSIDYSQQSLVEIRAITVDSLDLSRIDLLKIDVEGMELEVLQGAAQTVGSLRPIIIVERLKTKQDDITDFLGSFGYRCYQLGLNILAIHPSDSTNSHITLGQVATTATENDD